MKKLDILSIATAATVLFSASSVFAAETNVAKTDTSAKEQELTNEGEGKLASQTNDAEKGAKTETKK